MTIPKAIEIIDLNLKEAGDKMPPDVKDALELGKEALNYISLNRSLWGDLEAFKLKGETED